jgi:2,4-dienoyl-CoA reductase (NADPH2)
MTQCRLLEPLGLGARRARNRVVFGAHETNLARRRAVSERHVAYYRRRAVGGAGVIVVEDASVHPSDWPYERAPLWSDSGPGWAAVAAACHDAGALVLAGLNHAGSQGASAYSQAPLWAPGRVPDVATREVPQAMEAEDVAAVVEGFGTAAAAAVAAGCDGVDVNAGQFSLLRQFLSGLTNQRSDEWGTDRTRFARAVLRTVRDAVGPEAVVTMRLSCDELAPWAGIVPEAGAEIAAALAVLVDAVTVVRGSIFTASATRPDGHTEPGFNLELAGVVRAAVAGATAVVAQGSIVDVDQAEAALGQGRADAVEMTRAQIADPDLVAKLAAGERDRIRPCILCNQKCQVRDPRNPVVSCTVEPSAGHESDPGEPAADGVTGDGSSAPAPARRDVLVVGGGPAGLECARVAAGSGHRVRLVERAGQLGGAVRTAAAGAGRHRLAVIVDWLEAECRRLGVTIETGGELRAPVVERVAAAVVLCTGSRAGEREYAVDPGAVVWTAAEVLDAARSPRGADAALAPGPVVVWDPVGGPVAVSVAELLAGLGRPTTLVTPDFVVATQLWLTGDLAPANTRLLQAGVTLVKRAVVRAAGPGTVTVVDRWSATRTDLTAAVLVDAGPRLADDGLWRASGARHARAGDAVAPRTIHEAILEGRRAARALDRGVVAPAMPTAAAPTAPATAAARLASGAG